MENILLRDKIPPLSSHLNKSQSNTIKLNDFDYKKIFKRNELRKNNSIDFEELNSIKLFVNLSNLVLSLKN